MKAMTINSLGLAVAYNLLRFWSKLTNSSAKGAGVAIWCDEQLLVVRHSYRPGWALPGGRAKKNESPRETAAREVLEEVGIELATGDLVMVRENRRGHTLFECRLRSHTDPQVDNREVIEAKFCDPAHITDADWLLGSYLRNVGGRSARKPA